MNWLCRLGLHDWETLRVAESWHVKAQHDYPKGKGPPTPAISRFDNELLENRVCLRCGKKDDQISRFRDEYAESKRVAEARRKRAQEIVDKG